MRSVLMSSLFLFLSSNMDHLRCICKPRVEPILARVIPLHSMVAVAILCRFSYYSRKPGATSVGALLTVTSLLLSAPSMPSMVSSIVDGICNALLLPSTSNSIGTGRTPANSPMNPAITAKNPPAFPEYILTSASACSLVALLSRIMPPST